MPKKFDDETRRIGSLGRFMRTFKVLTDEEERYCVLLLRGSPRNEAALDMLFRSKARFILKVLQSHAASASHCGLEMDDLLSTGYEAIRRTVRSCDPFAEWDRFRGLLAVMSRNAATDRLRECSHIVRISRRRFKEMSQNDTFVHRPFQDIAMPEVLAEAESGLSAEADEIGSPTAEGAFLRRSLRRACQKLLTEGKLNARQRIVLETCLIDGRPQKESIDLMVEAGLKPVTESRICQLREEVVTLLGGITF